MALTQKQLEYQRQWRKNNPNEYRAQQVRTRKNRSAKMAEDVDYFAVQYYNALKTGAKNRGKPFNLTKKDIRTLVETKTTCAATGRKLTRVVGCPDKFSIDRIDNRYGYSMKNVQVVTQQANIHRLDDTWEDFVAMCIDVAKTHTKFSK